MFLTLATLLPTPGSVFLVHPLQLSRWLDEAWTAAGLVPLIPGEAPRAPFLGDAAIVDVYDLPAPSIKPSGIDAANPDAWTGNPGPTEHPGAPRDPGIGLIWHHLMYAYVIESTGAFEVFAEVVRRLVIGESLGTLSREGTRWLRATEELFFRDPPLFSIQGVSSQLRPSECINRRRAYWRTFSLDLPHMVPPRWGPSSDTAWKADIGLGVNTDFRAKWSELLRQIWLGIEHRNNSSGANATDPAFVAMLCTALKDMLGNRRRGGALAREEFTYVTTLSWFHLTLQANFPIIVDLKAQAASPEERLSMVAQRVGMAPAARSRELFLLAEKASSLLRAIELGMFDDPSDAARLYDGVAPELARDTNDIIDLWQSATGERVKERPGGTVAVSSPQPLRIPTPAAAAPAPIGTSSNGRG